ncbi:potassium channel family protein [Plasticicumulans acidivorans]|uniref:Voltage-gated potassium channel n=1 Tax=Plasticicumulans acidivorans TaxID=886464 RepID=A0A317MZK1_9GAMM|nr:NAD-binding protein [Plasticicumulans acidivorans]PWV64536.1 voltage-gated potassium channel [Plasticicumulans acidivorans]
MKPRRIAIFGYNKLGQEVARHLCRTPCELLIVDNDAEALARAGERGFDTVRCDYTDDSELARVGIGRDIDLIFCLLGDEAQNVFLVISVRALAPDMVIVAATDSIGSEQKLRAAGADKVIDPFAIAGARISDLLERPMVMDILEQTVFGQADLEMAEVPVVREGGLVGQRLSEVSVRGACNLVVVGLVRSGADREVRFATEDWHYRLSAGDMLLLVGPAADLERFRAEAAALDASRGR